MTTEPGALPFAAWCPVCGRGFGNKGAQASHVGLRRDTVHRTHADRLGYKPWPQARPRDPFVEACIGFVDAVHVEVAVYASPQERDEFIAFARANPSVLRDILRSFGAALRGGEFL